jgi:DNA invertase Pin-like site-specific DNA recombinase
MRRRPARDTHSSSAAKILRCAIYTRVSTEHGLDQDFNSLDAQREACSAYIKSQAHEGWRENREHYDDGGFSGGSLDRPALQRLLEDIESRKVDVIVVYKVDRLTRSLADFAKLVELFDGEGVSFVSVTQSFNTTSSMGRLTLNVLLSFAQFEREVTGERIRDKIAASKKKGIWVGGIIPFGYRLENRKLLIEESEDKIVRLIFERYLALGSIRALEQELNSAGILTRRRELSTGKVIGGIAFTSGPIAHILKNRTYIGQLNHRKNAYPADHAPIVSRELFDAVQKQLEAKRNARAEKHQASGALLIGKLFDQYGRPMTPTYACKGARRYRYYVSRSNGPRAGLPKQPIIRVRADEIEQAIVLALSEHPQLAAFGLEKVFRATHAKGNSWSPMALIEANTNPLLIDRVLQHATINRPKIEVVLTLEAARIATCDKISTEWNGRRHRVRRDIVGEPSGGTRGPAVRLDSKTRASLVRSIARGRTWLEEILTGKCLDAVAIAARENLSVRSVQVILSLASLSPQIVTAAAEGKLPRDVGQRLLRQPPLSWSDQHAMRDL